MVARRRTATALGVALTATLLAVLGVSSAGGAASAAASATSTSDGTGGTSGTSVAEEECPPGHTSAARRAHGSHAVDPNALPPANAHRLDRAVQRETARLWQRQVHRASSKIVVPTYVHVIAQANGKGGVTRAKVAQQVKVLNQAYAGKTSKWSRVSPFQFKLMRVDWTKNNRYYNWRLNRNGTEPVSLRAIKAKLHKGGPEALNIYITGLGDGLLGYATFPGEGDPRLDGVVILNGTLPGGTAAPYNKGDTLVHEVGHWLGLYHTFQGGCVDPAGDLVGDTPFQDDGENIYLCGSMDTCPLPGKDPTLNFMSYGNDACLNKFTAGQVQRQTAAWYALRDPSV